MTFIDEVKNIYIKAGNGGDGCVSFHRAKYLPLGGPDGGDGGRGGDIVLVCDSNISDLTAYKFKKHWVARNGEPGRGSQQHGKNGSLMELKVPRGTVVYYAEDGRLLTELTEDGQSIVLLEGGKGGVGNLHFKSSTNRAPRENTEGREGDEGHFRFVLKTIADVGLVGFPNAGKSSLISLVTNAHPKTAAYPFTTMHPNVGVMKSEETYESITVADIPGLIEGASENRGLGHRFLRHIERCSLLLFIIDISGMDDRKPEDDYTHLMKEIELYDAELMKKPRIVVCNKMDEDNAEENLKRFKERHGDVAIPISVLSEEGVDELRDTLMTAIKG